MKKSLLLIASFVSLLTSCSKSESHRYVYLSGKYVLTYAAINETLLIANEPAYIQYVEGSSNVIDLFQKDYSYLNLNVSVNNNVPRGFGRIEIQTNNNIYSCDFDYVCLYDKVYGGEIVQLNDTKPEFLGKQAFRGNTFGFVRTEAYLPDISDRRLVLEFTLIDDIEDLEFFDHNIF